VGLGVLLVHLKQIARPDRCLVATDRAADLDDHILVVVGVLGDQHHPEALLQSLGGGETLLGDAAELLGHCRVRLGHRQLGCIGAVGGRSLPLLVHHDDVA
jgi:hypothetical protein